MKVLQVIPAVATRYGGPSQAIYTMCRALQSQGVEILIATTNADGSDKLAEPLGERIVYQDVSTIFFNRQLSERFMYSRPLARWLEDNVKNFDLVYIHAIFSHACIAAALACRKRQKPYVVCPHGMLDPWSLKQKFARKRVIWHLGVKQMLMGAAAIHFTSAEEKRLAESNLNLSSGVVVPNSIDLGFVERTIEPFSRQQPELRNKPYILALSRIHPKKGFELLIDSFASLKRQRRFREWRLVFAGDGAPGYVDQLKSLTRRLGVGEESIFVGWLEGDRKYSALKGASLLAMPSYQENFGISLVEAMAFGVPVLVSPQVNLAPEIEEAGAGWIAALKREEMSRTMAEAMASEEERKHRGEKARSLSQKFATSIVVTQLLDMYRSLI